MAELVTLHTCDRCGNVVYAPDVPRLGGKWWQIVRRTERVLIGAYNLDGKNRIDAEMDLCESCRVSFVAWWSADDALVAVRGERVEKEAR